MTLQVCLVGTDGIVLASDQKTVVLEPFQTTGLISKFFIDQEKGIAISYAGCEISVLVGRRILANPSMLNEKPPYTAIQGLADEVYREQKEKGDEFLDARSELIAVSLNNLSEIYYLKMNDRQRRLEIRKDKAIAGHNANPACFFLERYYKQSPVAQLKFLAAHVILTAHELNPIGNEGLEIVTCTESGFDNATPGLIENLKTRSEELDQQIKDCLNESAGHNPCLRTDTDLCCHRV